MENFRIAIETAILIFPVLALVFTIFYILFEYHKYGSINYLKTIIIYSFIMYLFLVILPLPSKEFARIITRPTYNLQPFNFIHEIINNTSLQINDFSTYFPTLKNSVVYEAIFNVFLTIPFGVYLHYYFKCNFRKTIFYTFCLTLFFEVTQVTGLYFIYPKAYRIFDVDDLILNTLGGFIGYFVAFIFIKILPSKETIEKNSYIKGMNVSIFRRFVSLIIDIFIVGLLTFLLGYLVYQTYLPKLILIIPLLLYYTLATISKKTVGMAFLKLKFDDEDSRFKILSYYYIFLFEFFLIPIILVLIVYLISKNFSLKNNLVDYLYIISFAISLLILTMAIFKRIFGMPLFYEKASQLQIISTIKNNT